MTDTRDQKQYKIVTIGEGEKAQTWMAENLNYDPGQGGTGDAVYDWSWCYNNEPGNCNVAGRLYTWAAAIDSVKLATDVKKPQNCGYDRTCALPDTVYGICPPGWHLPDDAEWEKLIRAGGGSSRAGKNFKTQTGWEKDEESSGNGTDSFGFSALPAGFKYNLHSGGDFAGNGYYATFWSASVAYGKCNAHVMDLSYDYKNAYTGEENPKNYAYSIRCLKN